MITLSFNILIYTVIFLVIGLIKPSVALFFMEKPNRFTVIVFSSIALMIVATLFGEGNRQQQLEQQLTMQKKAPQIKDDPDEVPLKLPSAN